MEHYYARNDQAHQQFLALLRRGPRSKVSLAVDGAARDTFDRDSRAIVPKFAEDMRALHNRQWSEHIYNIIATQSQCPNDCRYCYMKTIKTRFYGADAPAQDIEAAHAACQVNQKRVDKKWLRVKSGASAKIIMFPSSHDIIPSLLDDYIAVARKILAAGHDLLIVSKPRMDCMARIADALDEYKPRVIWRLTIGSNRQDILNFWEPHAPPFEERLAVLRMLFARGFLTSVSMEPFLSDPRATLDAVAPFVSETIWIGTMSGLNEALAGSSAELTRLKALYAIPAMRELAQSIHTGAADLPYACLWHPEAALGHKVRWKAKLMRAIVEDLLH